MLIPFQVGDFFSFSLSQFFKRHFMGLLGVTLFPSCRYQLMPPLTRCFLVFFSSSLRKSLGFFGVLYLIPLLKVNFYVLFSYSFFPLEGDMFCMGKAGRTWYDWEIKGYGGGLSK